MREAGVAGKGLLGMGTAVILLVLGACGGPRSGAGFSLPKGDMDQGRVAFVKLNCTQCHTVVGETLTPAATDASIVVPLGGEVLRVRTYGQLVSSIIDPSHIISPQYAGNYTDATGRSLMPDYNRTMTVQEMIDMVTFLQAHYRIKSPEPAYYPLP